MVLVFSISDTRLCQTFKVFSIKRRRVGKTTNLPPAIIHMKTRENTPSDHEPNRFVQSCKGKMTLLGLVF
jgi:hypothetical protein